MRDATFAIIVAAAAIATLILRRRRRMITAASARAAAHLPEQPVVMSADPSQRLRSGEEKSLCVAACRCRQPGLVRSRVVRCDDALAWIASQESFPAHAHVITSLPDIGELKPHLAPQEYEQWFADVVTSLCAKLSSPHALAIFYVSDGRETGIDGSWLDKGHLAQLGARAAGALLVWHRIVLGSPPLQHAVGGRAGFVHLLCFSRSHRCRLAGMDVLPTRGYMAYNGAAGEEAVAAAVQYVRATHRGGAIGDDDDDDAQPPALVIDPFCGHGTVLALANAYGLDSMGVDVNPNRCAGAMARRPQPEDEPIEAFGRRVAGPLSYWSPVSEKILKKLEAKRGAPFNPF